MAERGGTVTSGSREQPVSNTSYRESYCGRVHDLHRLSFASYLTRPTGSGFTANHRPAVYYSPSLDRVDNPGLGLMLSDSFVSQTKLHYQPGFRAEFSGSLPNILDKPRYSGFHQLWSRPNAASAVMGKTPQQILSAQNHLTPAVSQSNTRIGPKGDTGFTKASDLQLYTFLDKYMFSAEPRRTQSSVTRIDFLPPSSLQGTDAIPGLSRRSCRGTGFTQGAVAPLAFPSSLVLSPPSERKAAAGKSIGRKEPTGFVVNAPTYQAFPSRPSDSSHIITQYRSKFCHRDDAEMLRCAGAGAGAGAMGTARASGYARRDVDRFLVRG